MKGKLNVVLYDDDTIGIVVGDDVDIGISPKVALEIAQSLITVALEADPTLDSTKIMGDYKAANPVCTVGRLH